MNSPLHQPISICTVFGTISELKQVEDILCQLDYCEYDYFINKQSCNCILVYKELDKYVFEYAERDINTTPHISFVDFMYTFAKKAIDKPESIEWIQETRTIIAVTIVMATLITTALLGDGLFREAIHRYGINNTVSIAVVFYSLVVAFVLILIPKRPKL